MSYPILLEEIFQPENDAAITWHEYCGNSDVDVAVFDG